jgi:hypothetical protein
MIATQQAQARPSPRSWRRITAQWLAVVVPPLAAFAQQQISYSLVSLSCVRRSTALLHLPTLVMLTLLAVATAYSWRRWTRGDQATGHDDRQQPGTQRFFALLGLTMSGISTIVLLAQWLPTLVLHPCIQ